MSEGDFGGSKRMPTLQARQKMGVGAGGAGRGELTFMALCDN